jgi:putative membrane protein
MAYDKVEKEDLIVRDYLAAERTYLANERTLLAYCRTALILFVSSLTMLKVFEHNFVLIVIAYVFLPLSVAAVLFGLYRFLKVRALLRKFRQP